MPLPDLATPQAALAAACAEAAREIDPRDPRGLDGLVLLVEALDVTLRPEAGLVADGSRLGSLRNAVGDHLVVLSAAGMPEREREQVCRSLSAALTAAAELLAAGDTGAAPVC